MASSHCGLAGTGRAFRLQLLHRVRIGEEVGHARSSLHVSRRSCRMQDGRRRARNAHKGCYAPFSPRARTRPPQRRAATAGPPPAPPEPSPDVPVPVPVPPAVLEHHLQAAQRIDQTLVLQTVLACCGVPPALAPGAAAAGPAMREAQRAFLTATVQPLGALPRSGGIPRARTARKDSLS